MRTVRIGASLGLAALVAVFLAGCASAKANEWNSKGVALAEAHKPLEAIAAYAEAIRLNPRLAKAHYNMGLEYMILKEPDQAITCFRRALDIEPGLAKASEWLTRATAMTEARRASFAQ